MVSNNLGDILKDVYTQEGKAAVVAGVIGKMPVAKELVERTFHYYVEQKDYRKAYAVALSAGMTGRLCELDERISVTTEEQEPEYVSEQEEREAEKVVRSYVRAAEYASIDLGLKTIDALLVLGRPDDAAGVAVEHGMYAKAVTCKEKQGKWKQAAEIAEEGKLYESAAANYEQAKDFGKAAEMYVAQATKEKEEREKSKSIGAYISKLGKFYSTKEQDLLIKAAANYERAGWKESAETTLKKVADREKVYAFFEKQGNFAAAESYARSVGDVSCEQLYKKADLAIHPEKEIQEREKQRVKQRVAQENRRIQQQQEMEIKRKQEEAKKQQQREAYDLKNRQEEMAAVKATLEERIKPFDGETKKYATKVTNDLYKICKESVEIVLRAYKVPIPEPQELADVLEEEFVNKNLLDAQYVKTMRTMHTIHKLIYDDKVKDVAEGTYHIYRKEAKRFVNQMDWLACGQYRRLSGAKREEQEERSVLGKVYDGIAWSLKELLTTTLAESAGFYIKRLVIGPAILSLGLLGKCAYFDSAVATVPEHKQEIVASIVGPIAGPIVGRGCVSSAEEQNVEQQESKAEHQVKKEHQGKSNKKHK